VFQGWEKPNFFGWCIGFLVLMQKKSNPVYENETMVLFQHLALCNQYHHWRRLGPLPYNPNLFALKPDFIRPQIIGFKKTNEKPNYKEPHGASLECFQVQPVACWHLSVYVYCVGVYSRFSYKMIDNCPKVLSFNWLFLILNRFSCDHTKYCV
jgi:hypothetical protein